MLKQSGATYHKLLDMFPCYITQTKKIDKKLMNVIIYCAVKGIGPDAMSKNIVSWHELEWQRKENQWAIYCLEGLNRPTLIQNVNRREDVEKFPKYFSTKMGGCTPSEQCLVSMFCSTVQKVWPYYNLEYMKGASSSKILAIDASYKLSKWMMNWGGKKYAKHFAQELINITKLY